MQQQQPMGIQNMGGYGGMNGAMSQQQPMMMGQQQGMYQQPGMYQQMQQPHQQQYTHGQYNNGGGYNSMNQQQGPPNGNHWGQQNSHQNAPADIMKLADQASNAINMLQQRNNTSQSYTRQSAAPSQPPPSHQSYGMHQNQPQMYNNGDVSEANLPVMVQYALQNLKATGHIEGNLDTGICRLIVSLPEQAALSALSAFSSSDMSKIRNKNGYLAGILRKHSNGNHF